MQYYTTGEVAEKLSISVRTLRYYDQIELMSPSHKDDNGKRLYSNSDLINLEKITILKMLNLSLRDIKKVLSQITTEQLLRAHLQSLEQQKEELESSINNTNTLINFVHLEGELKWEQLMSLIDEAKNRKVTDWNKYFNEEEETRLKEQLPKMDNNNNQIRKWINIIRRVENCLERNMHPSSKEAQILAEDVLILSEELFGGDQGLAEKFYEIRKSQEKSQEMNLYPVEPSIIDYMEKAIEFYELEISKSI
ncbi:MerR family transcriptional regulator [Ornithinibacillus halotolerans]|uniref:MerR family transcriptional regulator n=1 Tax=Ornithinibacillus halotolerans TaxID=1274357 RepID=A0A916W726_9BACI|nr:MerR family transcriptional regulator [Ornithinibacillus halotolerans]GGA72714.1 MerR family transcriptional regulator [Ornithinibacillus halotolerans]